MDFCLLLADGVGEVSAVPLRVQQFREFPGPPALSVHFRPVRNDALFASAKYAGQLAYRILLGEALVRSQVAVEFAVEGDHRNVTGRSSELLFALALICTRWRTGQAEFPAIAATGALGASGTGSSPDPGAPVEAVAHTVAKVAAAMRQLADRPAAVVFYPQADADEVRRWTDGESVPATVKLVPVQSLEQALAHLGIHLEKVYLGNPFRGLEHFEFEHRAIFFGRDAEVRDLVGQSLRREASGHPGILVEGASGSGKSSFLRAGVLPVLLNPRALSADAQAAIAARPFASDAHQAIWRPSFLVPPCQEDRLASSIFTCWRQLGRLSGVAADAAPASLDALRAWLPGHWPEDLRFIWMIDQFEELLSQRWPATLVDRFGEFLLALQSAGAWTLACVRSDATPALRTHESLRGVYGADEGLYYLAPMAGTALDQIIHLPAQAAGLEFGLRPDGISLEQVLREDAYAATDALPALQFTLNELYRRRTGSLLAWQDYERIGGLRGALASAAADILQPAEQRSPGIMQRLFRRLVSVDEAGAPSRRYASLKEFPEASAERDLLDRLVAARLCITDRRDGLPVAAFAHDTLLTSLPPLVEWLRHEAHLLQLREMAQRETRLWLQHQRADSWLAAPERMVVFDPLDRAQLSLPPETHEFLGRSQRRARRVALIKRTTVAAIALLALVASVAGWIARVKQGEAEAQTVKTLAEQVRTLTETAYDRLKDGDLAYARGIVLEVLGRSKSALDADPGIINVFQEVRSADRQVAILTSDSGPLRRVAWSPDGRMVATSSLDHTARLWDSGTGVQLAVLAAGQRHAVMDVDFSPDGSKVITASDTVRVWDVRTGARIMELDDGESGFGSAHFSPDGRFILTASQDLRIWDAATGRRLRVLAAKGVALHFATYSPDGRYAVTAASDRTARVWSMEAGKELSILRGHTLDVVTAQFSPDGTRVVTASTDNTVRIWDAKTGAVARVWTAHTGQCWGARYSPDGREIISVGVDNRAKIWNAETGELERVLTGHPTIVTDARYSGDGTRILTAGYDGTGRIWDAGFDGSRVVLVGHRDRLSSVAFSPDGRTVLTASDDETARLWNLDGTLIRTIEPHTGPLSGARFSPDGSHFLVAGKTVQLWDAKVFTKVAESAPAEESYGSTEFSPDGRWVAAANMDFSTRLLHAGSLQQAAAFKAHVNYINSVAFSPDSRMLASGSVDGTVRLWEVDSRRQYMVLPHHDHLESVDFSPDGSRLLTASKDGLLRIWNTSSGKLERYIIGHRFSPYSARFSPDGKRIVSSGKDRTLRIWDADSGLALAVLTGHANYIQDLAFSPDGRLIASASVDHTARIWSTDLPADLDGQVRWAFAAESDPLLLEQRTRIGLPDEDPDARLFPQASDCDRSTAAYYDPKRLAAGAALTKNDADLAAAVCGKTGSERQEPGVHYRSGRIALAAGDVDAARRELEAAVAGGYAAARVDLADLVDQHPLKGEGPERVHQLYEAAWRDGVTVAAFRLGRLEDRTLRSQAESSPGTVLKEPDAALRWYRLGAQASDPDCIGELAWWAEQRTLEPHSNAQRTSLMFEAFAGYVRAAHLAHEAGWPDFAWQRWRYRRATLARVLARQGLMRQVAEVYSRNIAERQGSRGLRDH